MKALSFFVHDARADFSSHNCRFGSVVAAAVARSRRSRARLPGVCRKITLESAFISLPRKRFS
jgi:hypothetical protein